MEGTTQKHENQRWESLGAILKAGRHSDFAFHQLSSSISKALVRLLWPDLESQFEVGLVEIWLVNTGSMLKNFSQTNKYCAFPPNIEYYSGTMDLFGDIDDISSESDEDNPPPIPRQPVVSTIKNLN